MAKPNFDSLYEFLKTHQNIIFCSLITLLGVLLRLYSYDAVPKHNWTADEYAFTWSGMSLLQEGIPTAWSGLGAYDSYGDFPILQWQGNPYRLVTPWFDHPPLFGIMVGFTAILAGCQSFFDCTLSVIRVPSLLFGIASISMLYFVAFTLFGKGVAIISSLLMATDPVAVILSRLAVSENFIVLLSLIVLSCTIKYLQTSKKFYLIIAMILASLAPLAKITGFYIVLFLCLILLIHKQWKQSLIAFVIGILSLSVYFLYGAFYDWELFLTVLHSHSKRFKSLLIIGNLLFTVFDSYKFLFFKFDIWFIMGWISVFPVAQVLRKYTAQIVLTPIVTYVLILLFTGAQSHFYPWYIIPLYPLLFLSLGFFIAYFFLGRGEPFSSSILLAWSIPWFVTYGLGTPWSKFSLLPSSGFKYGFIVLVCFCIAPFFFQYLFPWSWLKYARKLTSVSLIVVAVMLNILAWFNAHQILLGYDFFH